MRGTRREIQGTALVSVYLGRRNRCCDSDPEIHTSLRFKVAIVSGSSYKIKGECPKTMLARRVAVVSRDNGV